MRLEQDTRSEAVSENCWQTNVCEGWDINGNANGGYLLALAGRAMADASGRQDPITVSAHYLSPGKVGPHTVEMNLLKRGKRFTTLSGQLCNEQGKTVISVLAGFGELPEKTPMLRVDGAPPDLPPVEECTEITEGIPNSGFRHRLDTRWHPDDAGFFTSEPSGKPLMRAWLKFRDEEPPTSNSLLLFADALPPAIFNADLPRAWSPTVELTVHVRAQPVPGWIKAQFSTRFIGGGFIEEDGELWDEAGQLVAQSRQLALMPRPPE